MLANGDEQREKREDAISKLVNYTGILRKGILLGTAKLKKMSLKL